MKKLKLLLLIVALTLPFRGAMAAVGIFCHLGSADAFATAQQPHHHGVDADAVITGGHEGEEHSRVADSHHQAAQSDVSEDSSAPVSDTCAYCSASCGAAPLAPAAVAFEAPFPNGAERFPALPVPHVRSIAGGLERPPRTI